MAKPKKLRTDRRRHEIDDTITAKAARRVIRDVRAVQSDLAKAIRDNDVQRTRIAWITAITLLRSVGHVLAKVDVRRTAWLRDAISVKHQAVKQDPFNNLVFHEFIERERNVVVKEYKASIFDFVENESGSSDIVVTNIQIGTEVFSPEKAIGVGIRYWEKYLDEVEEMALVARRRSRLGNAQPSDIGK